MSDDTKRVRNLMRGLARGVDALATALEGTEKVIAQAAGVLIEGVAKMLETRDAEEVRELIEHLAQNPAAKIDLDPAVEAVSDIIRRRREEDAAAEDEEG